MNFDTNQKFSFSYFSNRNNGKQSDKVVENMKHEDGTETIKYESGMIYSGGMVNSMKNGFGVLKWPDGAIYEG